MCLQYFAMNLWHWLRSLFVFFCYMVLLTSSEERVHIGDIFQMGKLCSKSVNPRQPCYKLSDRWGKKDFHLDLIRTGYTDYYFRVLQEGEVHPEDQLVLLESDPKRISVAHVNAVFYKWETDERRLEQLLQLEPLSESWKKSIFKRLTQLSHLENPYKPLI